MAGLSHEDWQSIYGAISAAQQSETVVYGTVVKRDERRKLIWLREFGSQPIPLVGFKGHVKIYDDNGAGTTIKKVEIVHEVPKIGETAVVMRQFGSRRLPKCVGIVLSTGNFVTGG